MQITGFYIVETTISIELSSILPRHDYPYPSGRIRRNLRSLRTICEHHCKYHRNPRPTENPFHFPLHISTQRWLLQKVKSLREVVHALRSRGVRSVSNFSAPAVRPWIVERKSPEWKKWIVSSSTRGRDACRPTVCETCPGKARRSVSLVDARPAFSVQLLILFRSIFIVVSSVSLSLSVCSRTALTFRSVIFALLFGKIKR